MKENIIFWLGGPPVCCKGVFDAVADIWDGKIYYVCTRKNDVNRDKIIDSNYHISNEKIEYVFVENDMNAGIQFLKNHINDIHVFNGYQGAPSKYLEKLLEINKKPKLYIWAERVAYRGNIKHGKIELLILNLLLAVKHTYYAIKYQKYVRGFFPLGLKGVQNYAKLHWKKERLFPFLYVPEMNEQILLKENEPIPSVVKFVYLGRFSSGGKGTDILIDAFHRINNTNYFLSMVSGYGDYKNQTMRFIESNKNVEFGGTWPISEACERLSEYDVCIVPSRSEGWNPTVNEALMAGIGCIATDETVSDELITASGAGLVVKADSNHLSSAIDYTLEHPELVLQWKKAAYDYKNRMTAKACAQYFVDCIDFTLGATNKRPCPPWE